MEGLSALWAGSSQTKEAEVNRRIELGCAWSCVVGVVLLLIGFWPIAALLPVPPADYSAANIATTGVITLFKTGPFTYSGILGFYIPLVMFSVWLLVMPYAVYRAIPDEVPPADESSPAATGLMPGNQLRGST
jgi:hypothetical protein